MSIEVIKELNTDRREFLLGEARFVSYCEKYGVKTSTDELDTLASEGVLVPAVWNKDTNSKGYSIFQLYALNFIHDYFDRAFELIFYKGKRYKPEIYEKDMKTPIREVFFNPRFLSGITDELPKYYKFFGMFIAVLDLYTEWVNAYNSYMKEEYTETFTANGKVSPDAHSCAVADATADIRPKLQALIKKEGFTINQLDYHWYHILLDTTAFSTKKCCKETAEILFDQWVDTTELWRRDDTIKHLNIFKWFVEVLKGSNHYLLRNAITDKRGLLHCKYCGEYYKPVRGNHLNACPKPECQKLYHAEYMRNKRRIAKQK